MRNIYIKPLSHFRPQRLRGQPTERVVPQHCASPHREHLVRIIGHRSNGLPAVPVIEKKIVRTHCAQQVRRGPVLHDVCQSY